MIVSQAHLIHIDSSIKQCHLDKKSIALRYADVILMQKIRRKALWDRYADKHSKQNGIFTEREQVAEKKHSILKEDKVPGAKLLKELEKCDVEELKRWL